MKQTGKSGGILHDEIRIHFLKEPKQADFALKLALRDFETDGDVNALLDTLRLIAQSQGGLAKLARETAISRKALHEALSADGNPRLRTFQSVLEALGLRMSLKAVRSGAVVSCANESRPRGAGLPRAISTPG